MLENRLATFDDLDAVNELFTAHSEYVGFVMKVQLEESIAKKSLMVCVDTDKDEVVGAMNFNATKKGYVTLYEMATKYHGRGIGGKVMEFFLGAKTDLKLKVTEDNLNAKSFFENLGFDHVATEPGRKRRLYVMYYKTPAQKRLV